MPAATGRPQAYRLRTGTTPISDNQYRAQNV
jgi:hypothetical protein